MRVRGKAKGGSAPSPGRGVMALVALVTAAGAAIAIGVGLHWPSQDIALLVALVGIACLAEWLDVNVYGDSRVSVSVAPILAAGVLTGLPGIVVVAPAAMAASFLLRRPRFYKGIFNAATLVIAGAAYVGVFEAFGLGAEPEDWPQVLLPAFLGAVVTFAVNATLVATAIALDTRDGVLRVFNEKFRWLLPHYLVLGLLAMAMATAYEMVGFSGLALVALPLAMMGYAMNQYVERTRQAVLQFKEARRQLAKARERGQTFDIVVRRLAAALDRRDLHRMGHVERVSKLSLAIARELGMEEGSQAWEDLQAGAILHDIGQVAVPETVLHQPGKLTAEQWEVVRQHPRVGHEMLKAAKSLRGAAAIVLSHHEWYDGKGYPRGLRGEEIALGARIFAVADAFDAMTSNLPYRSAQPAPVAIEEIVRCRGSQFDPEVVEAFLSAYDKGGNGARPKLDSTLPRSAA